MSKNEQNVSTLKRMQTLKSIKDFGMDVEVESSPRPREKRVKIVEDCNSKTKLDTCDTKI